MSNHKALGICSEPSRELWCWCDGGMFSAPREGMHERSLYGSLLSFVFFVS